MAVDRANFIPICSFRKGKGLFSYENKPFLHPFGGDKRDRTADLLNAIQALSQLSYTPRSRDAFPRARVILAEPPGKVKDYFSFSKIFLPFFHRPAQKAGTPLLR